MGWEEWTSVESGGRCHSLGLRSWTRICCLKSWSRVDSAWSGLQIVPCVSLCQFHSASLQGRNISKYEICMFSVERWHVTTNCLYSLWHWEANRLIKEGTGNNKKQFSSQAEACRTWFQFDTRTLIIASDVTRLFHIAFWLFVSTYPRSCGSEGSWFQMWRDVQKHLGILRENSEKKTPEMLRYFSLPRNQNAKQSSIKVFALMYGPEHASR